MLVVSVESSKCNTITHVFHLFNFNRIEAHTALAVGEGELHPDVSDRVSMLTTYIKTDHKKAKIKRYIASCHSEALEARESVNIRVVSETVSTLRHIRAVINTVIQPHDQENILVCDTDIETVTIIHCSKIVTVKIAGIVTLSAADQPTIELRSCQFNDNLTLKSVIGQLLSRYTLCSSRISRACHDVITNSSSVCSSCSQVAKKRQQTETHKAKEQVLSQLNDVSVNFRDHVSNQLIRSDKRTEPYDKKLVVIITYIFTPFYNSASSCVM